jgi:hypothetical protein
MEGTPDYFQTPFWWGKLMKDSVFVNSVKRRWSDLRKTSLSPQTIFKFMDSTQVVLREPMQRNFGRFPLYGKKIWPNYFVGINANDELFWMQNWITARIKWLDASIASLDAMLILGKEEPLTIRAYPNPTSYEVKLEFPLPYSSDIKVLVYDLMGRCVLQHSPGSFAKGPTSIPVNISSLSVGQYVINVSGEEGILFRFPVVKCLD